jgi:uracil-DNA glycosylase
LKENLSYTNNKMSIDHDVLFADVPADWFDLLDNKLLYAALHELADCKSLSPPVEKIFEFARLTDLSTIRCVILGQDPYPKAGDAHGLAFSCLTGIPASLRNIYKCLINHKCIESMPEHGDLSHWAKQGVLLINTALTTKTTASNVHKAIWAEYTKYIIQQISKRSTKEKPIIFMLWGNPAKTYADIIDDNCIIMQYGHPSPLAQSHQNFLLCTHFVDVNKILKQKKLPLIDWNVDEQPNDIDKGFSMHKKKVVAFSDGSCEPNKKCPESRAGYGAYFVLGPFADVILYGNLSVVPYYATNIRAEGMAILKILEYLNKRSNEWTECDIVSDSDLWIKMITVYIPNWVNTSVDFSEKDNCDITTKMWDVWTELTIEKEKGIKFLHIASHGKDKSYKNASEGTYKAFCYNHNDYVDRLAKYARIKCLPGEDKEDIVTFRE